MLKFSKGLGVAQGQSEAVVGLFSEEPSLRKELLKSLSSFILPAGDGKNSSEEAINLITCDGSANLNNVLCVVCLKFKGASEEDEPLLAAGFLARACRDGNPLPLVSEDFDLSFCRKTFSALSLFLPAMIRRFERYGAPAPHFYRRVAQGILAGKSSAYKALGAHHVAWENFLFEQLVVK